MELNTLSLLLKKLLAKTPEEFRAPVYTILALAVAAAMVLLLFPDPATAVFSIVIMLNLVLLVFIVRKTLKGRILNPKYHWTQRLLLTTVVLTNVAIVVFLTTSFFFKWPLDFRGMFPRDVRLWGKVCTVADGYHADTTWISRAVVSVNGMDYYQITGLDGGFDGILENIPKNPFPIDVFIDHNDYQSATASVQIDRTSKEHFELVVLKPLSKVSP
jgi:hypothetical protein